MPRKQPRSKRVPDYVFCMMRMDRGKTRYNIVRLSDGQILAYGYDKTGCKKMAPAFGVPYRIMANGVHFRGGMYHP